MVVSRKIRLGILTASDRAFNNIYKDASKMLIVKTLKNLFTNPFEICYRLVPDNKRLIAAGLRDLCNQQQCALVLTTGGTGPSKRDVTPEATQQVCEKLLPGFGEAMRAASLRQTPTAILSRQIAGIHKKTLIINLPGNPKAIPLCLKAVAGALADCLKVIDSAHLYYRKTQLNINHH